MVWSGVHSTHLVFHKLGTRASERPALATLASETRDADASLFEPSPRRGEACDVLALALRLMWLEWFLGRKAGSSRLGLLLVGR